MDDVSAVGYDRTVSAFAFLGVWVYPLGGETRNQSTISSIFDAMLWTNALDSLLFAETPIDIHQSIR